MNERIEKAAEEYAKQFEQVGYDDDQIDTIEEAILYGANYALTHQWISVDELPKKDDEYFVKVLDEDTGERFTTLASFVRSQGGFIGIGGYKITHWMNIPPTEGGKE